MLRRNWSQKSHRSASWWKGPWQCLFANSSWRVRFKVFAAVTMKDAVFWDMTPCGSCKNRRFLGTYHLHHRLTRIGELRITAVASNRNSLILVTSMIETIRPSETSVLARTTGRHIPENCILRDLFLCENKGTFSFYVITVSTYYLSMT
jgi:hypothetical protein